MTTANKKFDVYEMITNQILDILDKGTVPWHQPWSKNTLGIPRNLVSKKEYRGINIILLSLQQQEHNYKTPYWLTFKQTKQLGGQVRKGEKSTIIVFWSIVKKEVITESNIKKEKKIFLLRYFRVFNLDQIKDINEKKLPADAINDPTTDTEEFDSIEACEKIIKNMPKRPRIEHGSNDRAYYNRQADYVHLPKFESFENAEFYYSTAFHELAHSTGHKSRLDRQFKNYNSFNCENYSKEELIAEMTAAMLCGVCGIKMKVIANQAAYIDLWRKRISNDKKLIISAASSAQKAADFIRDIKYNNNNEK